VLPRLAGEASAYVRRRNCIRRGAGVGVGEAMTLTIPAWLLWLIGIPLGVFVLWLVFLGVCMLWFLSGWFR